MKDKDGELVIDELLQKAVAITFRNTGSSSAKIIWDETVIVDVEGVSHRIIHNGVKLAEAGASMPPTLIPPGASAKDLIAFADGVNLAATTWMYADIIPCSSPGAICSSEPYLGKILTVLLTMESEGKKREYIGKLKVKRGSRVQRVESNSLQEWQPQQPTSN